MCDIATVCPMKRDCLTNLAQSCQVAARHLVERHYYDDVSREEQLTLELIVAHLIIVSQYVQSLTVPPSPRILQ